MLQVLPVITMCALAVVPVVVVTVVLHKPPVFTATATVWFTSGPRNWGSRVTVWPQATFTVLLSGRLLAEGGTLPEPLTSIE